MSSEKESSSTGFLSGLFAWKRSLPQPGFFEQLHKETRGVFPTNFLFDGAKFDFGKFLSPHFQVMHSFALGSQVQPPSFHFSSTYATDQMALQGNVDHEGGLQAMANYVFSPALSTKTQLQIAPSFGPASVQSDVLYQGQGFTADLKLVNPFIDGTGIYVGSLMHALSPGVSVGAQAAFQHPTPEIQEWQLVYGLKVQDGSAGTWTTNWAPSGGVVQTTYHHRVNEKFELATELQVVSMEGKREAVCTVGGKCELGFALFRGQVDTSGRVAATLEERLAPGFSVLFSGELDHMKGQSKFGIGMQVES